MAEYARTSSGVWLPLRDVENPTHIIVTSGNHYSMPSDVYRALVQRQGSEVPTSYVAQRPPSLARCKTDAERLLLLDRSWQLVYKRKAGKRYPRPVDPETGLQKGWGLKPETMLKSASLLTKYALPPIVWYWWIWDHRAVRRWIKGVPAKDPTRNLILAPRNVSHFAPYASKYPNDKWRKPSPTFSYVEKFWDTYHKYALAVQVNRPLTVEQAHRVMDDVATQRAYDRTLALASKQVEKHMAAEGRALACGRWVWG